MSDPVNSPKHYAQVQGIECLDIIEALNLPHHIACAFKYLWRYRDKGGLQDIEKAIVYLQRYLEWQRKRGAQ